MKNKIIIILLITFQFSFAQKKDENIGTEVVNVVKPYTPTISDAFKVKEIPTLNDNETSKKEEVKYQIFSFPVASTFTPSKGKAAGVEKAKQEKLFSNYATFGLGNYGTVNTELFVSHEIDNYQYVGGMVRHQSSQGGIKNVVLDDKFSESSVNLMYGYNRQQTNFKLDLGYKHEGYNWYGLPFEKVNFNNIRLDTINPSHQYNTISLGSELTISDSFFEKANLNFVGFSDNYGSKENRFIIKPVLNLDFGDTAVKARFGVDYLNTSFDTSYMLDSRNIGLATNINKSILIFSANPSFKILKDDLSVELGAEVAFLSKMKDVYVYSETNNETKSGFFIYPKVKLSYKVVGDLMIAFAGAEGGLAQNSYANFVGQNKFLSPTLFIEPTDKQYDIYAGLRGKLASTLSYNLKASYISTKNQALFKSNDFWSYNRNKNHYTLGNSMGVVYDDIKTFSFFGELKSDINKNISFGLNAEVNDYITTDSRNKAWNLPTIKASFTTDFNVGKKWYAGTQLFYVGERFDRQINSNLLGHGYVVSLDAYFDINAHVGYKYNERLTAFLKGNNLANQGYEKWLNYPVQGAQVIIGASYKFDF
ncbi:TonB dependent receptor [Flavobacterium swingsii]|uniref:TonB dependent receptor n=1 Tax=Flavobacterium swingsii TaxID=498292 RepID=A0A1I0WGK7_9FLAO|nr:TonB-dependent receptor [Flavobacterium swingsii]SFA87348.1 TonB dependent receptor [Flavobacterium swingsii]